MSVWHHDQPCCRLALLSVWCRTFQSGTTTDAVIVCLVFVCMSQSGTTAAPCRCLSGVVRFSLAPRPPLSLSVPYRLSQNGTTTATVVVCLVSSLSLPYCCLSHAICLKVGPRPPLSLSVWCRPYHSPTVVCPMQSVSKWEHDRPCHCPSGVVRIIPLLSVPCGLSQSGTTAAPVVVCLVSSASDWHHDHFPRRLHCSMTMWHTWEQKHDRLLLNAPFLSTALTYWIRAC